MSDALDRKVDELIKALAREKQRGDRLEEAVDDIQSFLVSYTREELAKEIRAEAAARSGSSALADETAYSDPLRFAAHLEGPIFEGVPKPGRVLQFISEAKRGERGSLRRRTAEGYVKALGGDPTNPVHLPDPDDLPVVEVPRRAAA